LNKEQLASIDTGNPLQESDETPALVPPLEMDRITSGPVATVAELIDLSELLLLRYSPGSAIPTRWAFRGQPRDFGTLVPSFQRQFSRRSIGTAEIIERRLIGQFRNHYAELKDRSADMPDPEKIGPGRDLRCLSVMQHYEIPTRLLDWTSNFWTAIYFACSSDPQNKAELWCYNREIFELLQRSGEFASLLDHSIDPPIEPPFLDRRLEERIVELDPQITPRMKQQEAHHTVSSNAFGDHAPLIYAALQNHPQLQWEPERQFARILIDGPCKGKALQFLAEEKNITASTIFPDVVGLGRFLRWQFESLRTMLF
jgi:hypothetical protein